MKSFNSYFHPDEIIRLLCKYRIKYAREKHKVHLLADISSSEKTIQDFRVKYNAPEELSKMLPARRTWYRPRPEERDKFSDSQRLLQYSLEKTISIIHIKTKDSDYEAQGWYAELVKFINTIHARINNPGSYKIDPPIIKALKKEKLKDCKECRPISLYNLEDRIIISLTAKYFTELFDDIFLDCSYAFRAVKRVEDKKIVRTHHDAIEKIKEYQALNKGQDIYVAECDIQKFFDCVNHDLIRGILKQMAEDHSLNINENAITILDQYLKSYSFSRDVFPKNVSDFFESRKMTGAKFKWILSELKSEFYNAVDYGENLEKIDIGIPQGGALSCFLSNLLLHIVDKAVVNHEDKQLLYLRFCDDMVILHTNIKECEKALERYEHTIHDLNLVIHKPLQVEVYSKEFWRKTKSKKPYKWSPKEDEKSNVPWLAFVGYQIKYDGSVRIRKKSFEKELKKQKSECQKVLKALDYYKSRAAINEISKKSKRQQLYALESRLISMSVGRVKLYDKNKSQTLCWTNGFRSLTPNRTSVKQMKLLDQNRNRCLYKVKRELKDLTVATEKPDIQGYNTFYGTPYSYYGIFKNTKEKPLEP